MTVLRKLYLQAGGGRRISALKRGLPTGRVFDLVAPVVGVLESEGMVAINGDIVHPIRKQTARVNAILAAGDLSDDNLVKRVRLLDSPV